MKVTEIEYSKTFNQGNFESEKIGIKIQVDESENPFDAFKETKALALSMHEDGKLIEESKQVAEATENKHDIPKTSDKLTKIKQTFPKELADLLNFEETRDSVTMKPKQFLGSANFAKIAQIVKDQGGRYVSEGRNSHFVV